MSLHRIHERSVYAPVRYEATRPYAADLAREFIKHSGTSASRASYLNHKLMPAMQSEVQKLGEPPGPGPVQAEISNIQNFAYFQNAGKVIYDVSQPLAQSLLLTDIRDIPCGELIFPLNSFYLHYGRGTGLTHDGIEIEGAYVGHGEGRVMIDLIPVGFGARDFFAIPSGESTFGCSVLSDRPNEPILESLSRSIEDIIAHNEKMEAQFKQQIAQIERIYGKAVQVPLPILALRSEKPLLKKALGLIVNTLFYLAAAPDDAVVDWETGAPIEGFKPENATDARAYNEAANRNLRKKGYRKVRFLGRKYAASDAGRAMHEAATTDRTMPTHIRRGHFRSQPHGPERSLRKTIFIAPSVINPDGEPDGLGRIYDVTPT